MNKLIEYIEMEEFKKILKEEKDKRFKLAYCLGMGSGLRISEIIGLKKEISSCCNSDLIEKRIEENNKKRKAYFCSKCKKEIRQNKFKRGKEWKIKPLTENQINLEKHQIRIFGKRGKERITTTSPWLNKTNIKLLPLNIERRTLQRRFKNLCKKVLNKNLHIHALRHGFGNYFVNVKNTPLPVVQTLLGHSNVSTTGIYTRANPKQAVDTVWENF